MSLAPKVTLEGVNGEILPLEGVEQYGAIFLGAGAKGLDMPPWAIQTEEYPALDGEYPTAVRSAAREVFLPLTVYGRSRPEMIAAKRQLLRAVSPEGLRSFKLVTAEPSAMSGYEAPREISLYYASGLEGDEGSDNGLVWGKYGLVARSSDPFFQDRQDSVETFFTFSTVADFFPPEGDPFLSADGLTGGFHLSAPPVVTNQITINNTGDVRVCPVWTIQGPMPANTPFNLVRDTTAFNVKQILKVVNLPLDEGETATIDTRPGRLLVSGSVGANVDWSCLDINPQFWTLDPGNNAVSIEQLPDGVEPTQLSVSFRIKHLGI
jgi:hypothetical protein